MSQLLERKKILAQEKGTLFKHSSHSLAMLYPSEYHVGMSSLGFQTIYRLINQTMPQWSAERAFLPEDVQSFISQRKVFATLESGKPINEHTAIGISIAYELEILGLIKILELSQIQPLQKDRDESSPIVILGGPLTFSNPLPAAPFADVVILGEAEELIVEILDIIANHNKIKSLKLISQIPHVLVPSIHGEILPKVAACRDSLLPAYSVILTPNTELSNMFLIEPERGCHRNCSFCVMRRSTNGGMRLVDVDRLLSLIPSHAQKVGLVGAAVSDHPKIVNILHELVETKNLRVGISSLRADRLNDEFVRLLAKGGYQTLTVASDAASQRLRENMEKKIKEKHILKSAILAKTYGIKILKVYMMIGVPDETDEDILELIRFTLELSKIMPTALGIAPFVPKYNTPYADKDFVGFSILEHRLKLLSSGLKGKAKIRISSLKEAYLESLFATSGYSAGELAYQSQKTQYGLKGLLRYIKHNGEPKRRPQQFVDPYPPRSALLKIKNHQPLITSSNHF